MENASKALLIAGEVLLGIILLTLFSYLFTLMDENTSRIEEKAKVNRINEFNQEFLNYEGRGTIVIGKDSSGNNIYNNPLTIQDVATLINLAIDNSQKYKFYTKVKIMLGSVNLLNNYNNGNKWLIDNINDNKLYKCKSVKINVDSLLVEEVDLEKIS